MSVKPVFFFSKRVENDDGNNQKRWHKCEYKDCSHGEAAFCRLHIVLFAFLRNIFTDSVLTKSTLFAPIAILSVAIRCPDN